MVGWYTQIRQEYLLSDAYPLKICKSSHLIQITDDIPSNLTFVSPCIANIFSEYNQQDATFFNLFISVRRSTCFRRVFRPSSGAQNCTHSVSLARLAAGSSNGLTNTWRWYVQFSAPDDARRNRLKHVKRLTEINKLWNVASCWLYSANILAMYELMNVKFTCSQRFVSSSPTAGTLTYIVKCWYFSTSGNNIIFRDILKLSPQLCWKLNGVTFCTSYHYFIQLHFWTVGPVAQSV